MEVERKIFGNTLLLATGQIVAQLANFGFVVLFARSFGASTLGSYSLAMAIGGLACSFVSFGTNSLTLKQISRDPLADRDIIGTVFPMQLLSGITIWSSLGIAALWFAKDRNAAVVIMIVAAFHVMLVWQALLLNRFRSRQLMQFVATARAATRVGVLILGAFAILAFQDATLAVASLPASALLVLVVAYVNGNRRFGVPRFALHAAVIADVIRKAWPFMSIGILAVLYDRLGVIFLRIFQSDVAVGYFSSADRLIVPFTAVFVVFNGAVFPALARLSADQSPERDVLARRFLRVLLALMLPVATLVYLYRTDIILLLYGEGFKEAIDALTILAWVIALRGFNGFLSMFSISEDLQTRLSLLKLFAILVFVAVCVLLIPRYSYTGLAYAMVVADVFLAVVMYVSLRSKNLLPSIGSILWRPALCCLIMIIVTMSLPSLALVIRFALSVLTFIAAAFVTGAIKHHDVGFLMRIANSDRAPDSD